MSGTPAPTPAPTSALAPEQTPARRPTATPAATTAARGAPRRRRRRARPPLVTLAGLLTLCYLVLPNLVVLLFSFNKPDGRFNYTWRRFSADAWTDPCSVAGLCDSLVLSLRIAAWATLGATVLGTAAAFALARHRFRGRPGVNALVFLPMAMPEVVMAASLLTLFLNLGVRLGFWTVLLAHITFCLSFVVTAVKARILSMDPRLEEAARDLYAGPVRTFLRVTLPIAAPGIAAGALLAFALSFDDFVITNFTAGSAVTFPMYVWGSVQRGTPVQVNVIGSAMFAVAVAAVAAGQLVGRHRRARADRRAGTRKSWHEVAS
ncbi:ABC transporter permease [Streptomyces sp. NPDC095613]|uniref:ABC transporter permease n=1 Tax=Streptomyces sp. NPDC095613 TaxID=3155540 RepID=UPI00331BFA90